MGKTEVWMQLLLALLGASMCYANYQLKLQMPLKNITEADTYMCYAKPVNGLSKYSVAGYKVDVVKRVPHHVSVSLCEDYHSEPVGSQFWDCRAKQGTICRGRHINLGQQGNTDPDVDPNSRYEHATTMFPDDVGIHLGEEARVNYVILQVHYKHKSLAEDLDFPSVNVTLLLTTEERPYTFQKLLLFSTGYIPPKSTGFSSDIAIKWEGVPVYGISYTIHTHGRGRLQEGYVVKNGEVSLIGRKQPQYLSHGKMLFDIEKELLIEPGDIIASRCIYDNNETFPIEFGMADRDEMCNFGFNFKYPVEDRFQYSSMVTGFQRAQNESWCDHVVAGTQPLCDLK